MKKVNYMKSIAMFIFRDKFTDGFISFFEKYFLDEYNFTFFTIKNGNYKLSEHAATILEVEKFMDIFLGQKYDIVNQCDVFIISGFFVHIKHGYRFDAKLLPGNIGRSLRSWESSISIH